MGAHDTDLNERGPPTEMPGNTQFVEDPKEKELLATNYGKSFLETEVLDENHSPIEEVNLTVPITDDPTMPVWTFRMWFLGIISCILLAFLNQFFSYRREPLTIGPLTVQIVALPLGKLMASTLPTRMFFKDTRFAFSFNPGPFNTKEHVLITIFANAGAGGAYAINIITIVKAFYMKRITFIASLLITITTQMIGYGWAGIFRSFLVNPGVMWWPASLVQVTLFRTLHEPDIRPKRGLTRVQFFMIGLACSFGWYVMPGYLFPMLSSMSWVCWAFPNSVLAQQLGSGMEGLGLGAFAMDWATINSFLGSPLATPWFAIANIGIGFVLIMYVITPIAYFANIYNAKTFPIFSPQLFKSTGAKYNVENIISDTFTLDTAKYASYGPVHLSTFFAITYGVGFAALTSTVSHVALFYGKHEWNFPLLLPGLGVIGPWGLLLVLYLWGLFSVWEPLKLFWLWDFIAEDIWRLSTHAVQRTKEDVHTRLMKVYRDIPQWWFHILLLLTMALAIIGTEVFKSQLQLPWWGILLACGLGFFFTLPIGIIAATTNQVPGLNIITELIIGYLYPGRPVANVCFKTYGYISMIQAVNFLSDFKLGHYMKVPPRSMFAVQLVGTVVAAVVSVITAWWMLTSISNICNIDVLPPNSPWTCPGDRTFFDASVIWGLVGPKRIFGSQGLYKQINWWFLIGAVAPLPGWLATKIWPHVKLFRLINTPILVGATAGMPPATSINYTSWLFVGFIFNFLIFRFRKAWWSRYNYLLAASLDAGLAFMGVALYFVLQYEQITVNWWGQNLDNCPLATCPTQRGLGQPNPNCPAT